MSLLKLIETRYGDPVTSIAIGLNEILIGSAMGRLIYYSLPTKSEVTIFEISEEMISDISPSQNGLDFYVSVGDSYALIFKQNDFNAPVKVSLNESKAAHIDVCERSFSFQNQMINCILITEHEESGVENDAANLLSPENIIITNLETQITRKKKTDKLISNRAIPHDFDGIQVIWIERIKDKNNCSYLMIFDTTTGKNYSLLELEDSLGIASFIKLVNTKLIIVFNHSQIEIWDIAKKCREKVIYKELDIISSFSVENSEKSINILFLNEKGIIKIIDIEGKIKFEFKISHLIEKSIFKKKMFTSDLIGLSYPYFIRKRNNIVALSSDLGVLIIDINSSSS